MRKITEHKMWMKICASMQSRGDVWMFCVFLVVIPFSVRKVIWFLPLQGGFNEYADVSLYASDIVLGVVFFLWYYINNNTSVLLSRDIVSYDKKLSSISLAQKLIIFLPAAIVVLACTTFLYSEQIIISVFFIFKLIMWYGMFLFVIFRIVPRRTLNQSRWINLKLSLKSVIFSGVAQSMFGIIQVLRQKSIGLVNLKESVIGVDIPGVAKVIFNNEVYIRAYGMLPHPNILGGFLFVSIVSTHLYFKLFHVEQNRRNGFRIAILMIQYIGIVLTFSKSAIAGLVIALLYTSFVSYREKKERSPNNEFLLIGSSVSITQKKRRVRIGIMVIVFMAIITVLSMFDKDRLLFQSLRERMWYQSIALNVIHNHPILGISCGQLVIFMSQQHIYPLLYWQLQPVHNVFLLVWAELGVFGFGLFALWWSLFLGVIVRRNTDMSDKYESFSVTKSNFDCERYHWLGVYGYGMIVGVSPILLFDHYVWDIQQGQCILWFATGLFSGYILYHKK